MRFEKWQALGNDYIIIEAGELPWPLSKGRIERICSPHFGCQADGILLIDSPKEPGFEANLRIFNTDGSEAELSGNGVRQAVLFLRRSGRTDKRAFSVGTEAGEVRATVTSPTTCDVEIGRARLSSMDFPGGGEDGRGTVRAAGRDWPFQHVSIGNPQCVVDVGGELEKLDLAEVGPEIESAEIFPNRTNVSFMRRDSDSEVTARIFERGVGETLSSGTGACGAAVASVLEGMESPVTVHLDGGDLGVEISDDMEVRLSGWALPVFSGEFSDEFLEKLEED